MKRTVLLLIIIAFISKFIGFGREMVLSYFYGASSTSDAYIIALTIPTVIFAFIGKAISTSYIPMYNSIHKNFGTNQANLFTNNLLNVLSIISILIMSIGVIYTEPIVKVFASGFEGTTLTLAVKFTRISMMGIVFTAMIHIFKAYLNIKGNYIIPALIGLPMNIIIILSILISAQKSTMVLAYGILISVIAQLILLLPYIKIKGFNYKFFTKLSDRHIQKMLYLSIPIIIGVAVNDINKIVDKTIASGLSEGAISALNYAGQINGFVQGIVVTSIATVMYPLISKMAVQDNITGLKKTLAEAISWVNILIVPATIGSMILAQPLVEFLFGRGAFDERAVIMTKNSLFFYSIGMLGIGLREILSRPFFALQDTRTPMINASIGMVVNIILNLILSHYLGISGIALATSIAAIFTMVLMFISLRKRIGTFGIKSIIITFLKVLLASIIMAIVVTLSFNYINVMSKNFALILSILIGVLTYAITIYFLKIEVVEAIIYKVKLKKKSSK